MKNDKTPFLLKFVRWFFPLLEKTVPFLAHRYFIKIFFTPLNYKTPEKELVWEEKSQKFSVLASGKRIQCYSWGKGPVILLIHGWAGRATQFRKFIEVFTELGYRVVGFDGPAHGRSEGKETNIDDFYEALRSIYKVTGEPLALICHSFGGTAALFSAKEGLAVRKLINIASPTIGDEIINTYLRAINGSKPTGDFFKNYVMKKTGKTFDDYTSLSFIKDIKQDISLLLVHDENDSEVYLKHALALKELYPSAKLLVTKDLGHTRILRDEEVIANCVTFVREGRLKGEANVDPTAK
jgi:pimeloyl-ACP methyl ester carboxylesterase